MRSPHAFILSNSPPLPDHPSILLSPKLHILEVPLHITHVFFDSTIIYQVPTMCLGLFSPFYFNLSEYPFLISAWSLTLLEALKVEREGKVWLAWDGEGRQGKLSIKTKEKAISKWAHLRRLLLPRPCDVQILYAAMITL